MIFRSSQAMSKGPNDEGLIFETSEVHMLASGVERVRSGRYRISRPS